MERVCMWIVIALLIVMAIGSLELALPGLLWRYDQ